jgi:hypothetical protein
MNAAMVLMILLVVSGLGLSGLTAFWLSNAIPIPSRVTILKYCAWVGAGASAAYLIQGCQAARLARGD